MNLGSLKTSIYSKRFGFYLVSAEVAHDRYETLDADIDSYASDQLSISAPLRVTIHIKSIITSKILLCALKRRYYRFSEQYFSMSVTLNELNYRNLSIAIFSRVGSFYCMAQDGAVQMFSIQIFWLRCKKSLETISTSRRFDQNGFLRHFLSAWRMFVFGGPCLQLEHQKPENGQLFLLRSQNAYSSCWWWKNLQHQTIVLVLVQRNVDEARSKCDVRRQQRSLRHVNNNSRRPGVPNASNCATNSRLVWRERPWRTDFLDSGYFKRRRCSEEALCRDTTSFRADVLPWSLCQLPGAMHGQCWFAELAQHASRIKVVLPSISCS